MELQQIMVVAGEASGDQHAADLVAALRIQRPELRFFGMGGPKLAAQGVELIYGAHEVSVMGFTEVLPKLRRILRVIAGLERSAQRRMPALAILVDIPDFNLRLARSLKKLGIRVVYYISPMVWAWRSGRVDQIAGRVDEMLCILPFEESFYRRHGVRAHYVGSPVLEQVPTPEPPEVFRRALGLPLDRPTLALLPGSRMSEIQRLLPAMVAAAKLLSIDRPRLQVVVPIAPGIPRDEIAKRFAQSGLSRVLIEGRAPEVVGASDAAIVASGTATLEAGLMLRPFVVVYRLSPLSYGIGRIFVRVAHVSLVNLLRGHRIVPELLQGQMKPQRIARELAALWNPGAARDRVVHELTQLRADLGAPGAAERAATRVLALL